MLFMPTMASHSSTGCWLLLLVLLFAGQVAVSQSPGAATGADLKSLIRNYVHKDLNTTCYRVIMDPMRNDVIVGCKNFVYRLAGDNLEIAQHLTNGPVPDNKNCPPSPISCRHPSQQMTDQENRILLINQDTKPNPTIITCGTAKQGMCFLIKYLNFGSFGYFGSPEHKSNYVASRENTIAFFAKSNNGSVLMLGHEPDDRPDEFSQPLISARKMDVKPFPIINLAFNSTDGKIRSAIDLKPDLKRSYLFDLVYGFDHEDFAYFVSTQQASINSRIIETRLSRVCLNDATFRSYSEITIQCVIESPPDVFNVATAAELGVIGSKDTSLLNLAKEERILYVSFMQTRKHTNHPDKDSGSAVCGFAMSEVEKKFETMVTECFEGKSTSILMQELVRPDKETACSRSGTHGQEFMCGNSYHNIYITSYESLESNPLIHIKGQKITSLLTFVDKEQTVAAIGTSDGNIIKALINNTILYSDSFASEDNDNSEDREIRREAVIDRKGEFMYAITGKRVVRFPLKQCDIYTSCGACLATADPQSCGWCNGKCCSRDQRPSSVSEQEWRSCSPVIYRFSPSSGAAAGGTNVTIHGDNFGSSQSGGDHRITLAGVDCKVLYWHNNNITCRTEATTPHDGSVTVTITDTSRTAGQYDIRGTGESLEEFSFLDPKITAISPKYGPVSGGAVVIVSGKNLDIGSDRKVLLLSTSSNITCTEHSNNGEELTCITGPYQLTPDDEKKAIIKKPFFVQLDDWSHKTIFQFELRPDPVIKSVEPLGALPTGSNVIHVRGQHLSSMQESNPRMKIFVPKISLQLTTPCQVHNDTYMRCLTPAIDVPLSNYATETADLYIGMGVTDVSGPYELKIYPIPSISKFVKGEQKVFIEDPVVEVFGSKLNAAYEWDIEVWPTVPTIHADNYSCISFEVDESWQKLRCRIAFSKKFRPAVGESFNVSARAGVHYESLGVVLFEHQPTEEFSFVLACVSVLIVLIIFAAIGVFIYLRRKQKSAKPLPYTVRYDPNSTTPSNPYTDNVSPELPLIERPAGAVVDSAIVAMLNDCNKLLAKEWLTLGEILGKGHFGCVYRARLYNPEKDMTTDVAVKTMHNTGVTQEKIDQFIQEALIMKDFDHPHVLTLIGLCFPENGQPMVVTPFMSKGDLHKYVSDESNSPRVRDLIRFGVDIAKGMEYLADQKFVHRDLAARNCILDENLNVKVADFGLSRDVYEQEYYRAERGTELPVKWMAPECLESKKCTTKSDVWSYAVVLWEILTRGRPPYPDVNNWDMARYLKEGRRLPRPDSCPGFLFKIMVQCWNEDPEQRPTFTELVDMIESQTKKLDQEAASRKVGLRVVYVNVVPYYKNSVVDDRAFGTSALQQSTASDSSSAVDSGFATSSSSASNRSHMPRIPAISSLPRDSDICRQEEYDDVSGRQKLSSETADKDAGEQKERGRHLLPPCFLLTTTRSLSSEVHYVTQSTSRSNSTHPSIHPLSHKCHPRFHLCLLPISSIPIATVCTMKCRVFRLLPQLTKVL